MSRKNHNENVKGQDKFTKRLKEIIFNFNNKGSKENKKEVIDTIYASFKDLVKDIPSDTKNNEIKEFKQSVKESLAIIDISEPKAKKYAISELLQEVKNFAEKSGVKSLSALENESLNDFKQNLLKAVATSTSMLENTQNIVKPNYRKEFISNLMDIENFNVTKNVVPSAIKIEPKLNPDDQKIFNEIVNSRRSSKGSKTITDSSSSNPPPLNKKTSKVPKNDSHMR